MCNEKNMGGGDFFPGVAYIISGLSFARNQESCTT